MVHLNVGGKTYCSSMGTLLSVPNTYFWDVLGGGSGGGGAAQDPVRTQGGEVFIDRSGKVCGEGSCMGGAPMSVLRCHCSKYTVGCVLLAHITYHADPQRR